MLPIVDSVAAKLEGKVKFFKVDVNKKSAKDLVRHLSVPKVPYLIVFKDGQQAALYTTALSRPELYSAMQSLLDQGEGGQEDEDIY
jgi:thioredoxin-like negative regulator of GroEL